MQKKLKVKDGYDVMKWIPFIEMLQLNSINVHVPANYCLPIQLKTSLSPLSISNADRSRPYQWPYACPSLLPVP